VHLILDCLLYFTSFGAIFVLFASVVSIAIGLLRTLQSWAIAEPDADTSTSEQFRPQALSYIKRVGQ
jgi:hypothetical protein